MTPVFRLPSLLPPAQSIWRQTPRTFNLVSAWGSHPLEGSGSEEPANTEEAAREGFLEEATLSTWKPKISKAVPAPENGLVKGTAFPEKC